MLIRLKKYKEGASTRNFNNTYGHWKEGQFGIVLGRDHNNYYEILIAGTKEITIWDNYHFHEYWEKVNDT